MDTPIYDFLKKYADKKGVRAHMPGHKGLCKNLPDFYNNTPLVECAKYDITEILGADELFCTNGIIAQSEENTAQLYGSGSVSFCTGGSTLCIQTMLALVAGDGDKIICARNVHVAFVNACGLLNLTPIFLKQTFCDNCLVGGIVDAQNVEQALQNNPDAKAVYITSPDYLGNISDVKAIADIAKKYNVPLVVDNAHGAYLKFLQKDIHPITLGATLCCDSAHKTLPVLTGGAYLHIAKNCAITKMQVKEKMAMFGSTSPSYLTMMSLDLNNKYLAENASADFFSFEQKMCELQEIARKKGFNLTQKDIAKLTFDSFDVGISGEELAKIFRQNNIEPEYVAAHHMVLMLSPFNRDSDFVTIKKAINSVAVKDKIITPLVEYNVTPAKMSIRQAIFAPKQLLPIEQCVGKIAAQTKIKCPPGVPIIISGEEIDEKIIKLLKKSSINSLYVVK